MKSRWIKSVVIAASALLLMGEATAMASQSEEQPKAETLITYNSVAMRGGTEIRISSDRKLHFEGVGNVKPKSADAAITESEFKELQDIIQSKEFLALKNDYITKGKRDGFSFSIRAKDKYITVENHESPAALAKLTAAIDKLREKYISKDNDE